MHGRWKYVPPSVMIRAVHISIQPGAMVKGERLSGYERMAISLEPDISEGFSFVERGNTGAAGEKSGTDRRPGPGTDRRRRRGVDE
jgi:hypothetical protein